MEIEDFPTSNSALRMMDTVTKGFYERSYVAKWLYQVMGIELDSLHKLMEELPRQIFPETATWGLAYHEQKWQLPVRENLTYDERRRIIYQKRDCRMPMTPYRMEKYLADATGFNVHIADVNDPGEYGFISGHPNVFRVDFAGEGTLNLKQIYDMIDHLKQSHTTYTVGDRMDAEIDNRTLNQVILQSASFMMSIPEWYVHEYVLDGSWPLDGSVLLHTRKSYDLVLGMKIFRGDILMPLSHGATARITAWKKNKEMTKASADYCTVFYFNEEESTALTNLLVLSNKEDVSVTLETKNRDRWFLDGTVPLDGTRKLNSVCKKEEIS